MSECNCELGTAGLSVAMYVGFWAWILVLAKCVPGKKFEGLPLKNSPDRKLVYTLNGLRVTLITWLTYLALSDFGVGLFPATIVYDHYMPLSYVALGFSLAVSLYFYHAGSKSKTSRPTGRGFLYDFWCGLELNPSIWGLDVKMTALKGTLNGWIIINFAFLAKQSQLHGFVSHRMLIYFVFSLIYSVDYYYFESVMLSTWDITDENLGFMLLFGYFWWMLFAFSIQPHYLLDNLSPIPPTLQISLLIVFLLGYYLFRTANLQKNDFKINASKTIWGSPPKTIGGKILISGWWGLLRKPNYLGDWIMAICFSLPCGFSSPIPYLYPIYLIVLNLFRAHRDQKKCAEKYGHLWTQYLETVPYLVIPKLL